MTFSRIALAGTILAVAIPVAAQTISPDENQIRGLVAAADAGKPFPAVDDRIFWSGAYRRPIVGKEQGEEVTSDRRLSNRVTGSQRTKTTIRRIEIAKSGDLAYEFSDAQLSFELKGGKTESFPTSVLRVWRKEAGQWRVAASFQRPHE
jgi:ketosteroid isomerase-like protein